MSRAAVVRRRRVLEAMQKAFPAATWRIRDLDVIGRLGAATIGVSISDHYRETGCSRVTVHPTGKSVAWDETGSAMPRSGRPASIVAAARVALRQTIKLGRVAEGANRILSELPW